MSIIFINPGRACASFIALTLVPSYLFAEGLSTNNSQVFLDSDGDGQTDIYELEQGTDPHSNADGKRIYLEAEYPTNSRNFFGVTETSEPSYSGDGYLLSFSNTSANSFDGTSQDFASYDFSVPENGDYDVYFRVDHDKSGNNDSWFHRLDSGTWVTENGHSADQNKSFHWVAASSNPVTLSTGPTHTLEVANREDGLALDKIAIIPTGADGPTGIGSLAINMPRRSNYAVGGRIIASHYNSARGVSNGADGTNIEYFDQSDFVTFDNVDFTGVKTVVFEIAKGNTGGALEIRKGGITGTILATYHPGNTTGWTEYINWPVSITEATGVDTLTLVGTAGEGLCNIRALRLSADTTLKPSPPRIGLHPGDLNGSITDGIADYEREIGIKFDHILLFQGIYDLNFDKVSQHLDAGYNVVLNLEFFEREANLRKIVNGDYDTILDSFITQIVNDGRGDRITMRTLHEFNANWYNWSVFYAVEHVSETSVKQEIANLKAAWIYLVKKFRDPVSGIPDIKFQFNYNWNTLSGNIPTTFEDFYPGDDYVDMILVTCYNRSGTGVNPNAENWKQFFENFENPYRQITSFTDLPIGIAETSSSSYGGDKAQWFVDAWKTMAFEYPRVTEIDWFFENKDYPGEPNTRDWDLNTEHQRKAFKKGYHLFLRGRNSY